jgi:hypothetical protein
MWTPYRISLRLLSPLHIGWRKIGNLQQTRPYVTGRSLWGALTAGIARSENRTDYERIGKLVDDELRLTYFYPKTKSDEVDIWPWIEPGCTDDGVKSNRRNIDEFSWLYLGSYANTALVGRKAEEGTLHETECIFPKTRTGEQVNLLGYIIEKNNTALNWQKALKRMQLGGERRYGWGRVELASEPHKCERCFGYEFQNENLPKIVVPKNESVLAHTLADGLDCEMGTIEPLVGRETSRGGFGSRLSVAQICWVPGSRPKNVDRFEILPRGIWQIARS